MAGRKPKPTAVKKLEGNPGKRKLNEADDGNKENRELWKFRILPGAQCRGRGYRK